MTTVRPGSGLNLLLCLSLAACGDGGTGTDAAASQAATADAGAPTVAAAAADCPRQDAAGRVAIAAGLDASVLRPGHGQVVVQGDHVVVNAKLWVHDTAAEGGKGEFVWESGTGGFDFVLGDERFIAGWSPGIACMRVGERRELLIASPLAYGEDGRAPIPPHADIIYDLELLRVIAPEG